jgi:hypothetical protein
LLVIKTFSQLKTFEEYLQLTDSSSDAFSLLLNSFDIDLLLLHLRLANAILRDR